MAEALVSPAVACLVDRYVLISGGIEAKGCNNHVAHWCLMHCYSSPVLPPLAAPLSTFIALASMCCSALGRVCISGNHYCHLLARYQVLFSLPPGVACSALLLSW